jgi:hypothetical protein
MFICAPLADFLDKFANARSDRQWMGWIALIDTKSSTRVYANEIELFITTAAISIQILCYQSVSWKLLVSLVLSTDPIKFPILSKWLTEG